MNYKKFLGAASAVLTVIILTLMLAPAAGAASKYKVLHRFQGANDGSQPWAGLILDAAGNLYGTTPGGGAFGDGTVFKLAPNQDGSWTESVLHSFNGGDGQQPFGGLIFDAAGNLYGTTEEGGQLSLCGGYGCGVVFKLAPNQDGSWTESVLHSFNVSDGAYPAAGLIFDAAGNLYGTADGGQLSFCGGYVCGVVFKLAPNQDGSWTESVLHSFNDSDGAYPAAGLIFDAAGNLYGTTQEGGVYQDGVVFKLAPNVDGSWTETVLHSFGGTDGWLPVAGLIFDAAGNLYGTMQEGGVYQDGVVFKLAPNVDGSWTETVLHSFEGTDGKLPFAGLIFDAAGNLYGTALTGGSAHVCSGGCGVVFKLAPNLDGSWAYSLIHVFLGHPAEFPFGGLVLGGGGTLYGTTRNCGSSSGCNGVVYQITP